MHDYLCFLDSSCAALIWLWLSFKFENTNNTPIRLDLWNIDFHRKNIYLLIVDIHLSCVCVFM